MRHLCLILLFTCLSTNVQAGLFELSAMSSLKLTNIDDDTSSESRSASGSIAYYFWQQGALEFTYMQGYNFSEGRIDGSTTYDQVLNYTYKGVDFIYNLGTKESAFNPYLKAGLAEINKELQYRQNGTLVSKQNSDGQNLTYGAGFKVKMSKTLSFRVSYDVWKGPINKDDVTATSDSSFKIGLTWYL